VAYTIINPWNDGFQGNVKITNTSATAVTGWTLRWTFANGQVLSQSWGGTYVQTGANVAMTNVDWNRVITANGGTAEFGFIASHSGTNAKPTSFTLNGAACTVV
jgi:cellulase/cellobiase CelA1